MNVIQLRKPGGPEVLERAERPLPEPAPNAVRVRALAIGVSSADMLVRNGTYKWMPPLPAIPGNELAGEIEALGREVSGVQVGQRVLVSSRELSERGGCYAEAIAVPASALYTLPESVSPHDAVSLANYQLAGALLYESGIREPRSIVVYGAAGGVGSALVQLGVADGIETIGIVSSEAKREFASKAGAPHVIRRDSEDVRARVMAITGGRGVDAVFAMAGATFTANLDLLAPTGTLVSFGVLGGMPGDDLFAALRARLGKSLGIRCYSIHTLDHEHEKRRALMQRAIDLMAAGRIKPPPPTLLPLAEARRAHEMMEAGDTLGKLVLVP
jgi:NADPH2:quinone reductase